MRRLWMIPIVVTLVVSTACTSDSDDLGAATPRATSPSSELTLASSSWPSPTPEVRGRCAPGATSIGADGWPEGAVGPLVVYGTGPSSDQVGSPSDCLAEYVVGSRVYVYDLGAKELLFAWSAPGRVQVGGTRVFVSTRSSLWTYALDGTGGRELIDGDDAGLVIEAVVPSEQGSAVAVAHYTADNTIYHRDHTMKIIQTADGFVSHEVSQTQVDQDLNGFITPVAWGRRGAELALYAHAHKEHIGRQGVFSMDGDLRFLDTWGHGVDADPFGVRPTAFENPVGFFDPYSPSIELRDPVSGALVASVLVEWPSLLTHDWAPDGSELLYQAFELDPALGQRFADALANPDLGGVAEGDAQTAFASPSEWFVLPVDGSGPEPIESHRAAFERWYGERAVTFACGSEVQAGRAAHGWARPRFEASECQDAVWELRVGATSVGTGVDLEVHAIVDRATAP